jgi:hypothetical protein
MNGSPRFLLGAFSLVVSSLVLCVITSTKGGNISIDCAGVRLVLDFRLLF